MNDKKKKDNPKRFPKKPMRFVMGESMDDELDFLPVFGLLFWVAILIYDIFQGNIGCIWLPIVCIVSFLYLLIFQ